MSLLTGKFYNNVETGNLEEKIDYTLTSKPFSLDKQLKSIYHAGVLFDAI